MGQDMKDSSRVCQRPPLLKKRGILHQNHRAIIVTVSLITILSTSALSNYTAPRPPIVPPFIVPETNKLVYCSAMEFLGLDWGGTLDPARACRLTSMRIVSNCYDTLVTYDRGRMDRFRPLLVTEVPSLENGRISPDGLTYRFTIRSDAPLTSEDIALVLLSALLSFLSG